MPNFPPGWHVQGLNMYWDANHFLPAMYENMNDLLFNMLCPEGAVGLPM